MLFRKQLISTNNYDVKHQKNRMSEYVILEILTPHITCEIVYQ